MKFEALGIVASFLWSASGALAMAGAQVAASGEAVSNVESLVVPISVGVGILVFAIAATWRLSRFISDFERELASLRSEVKSIKKDLCS